MNFLYTFVYLTEKLRQYKIDFSAITKRVADDIQKIA